MFNTSAPSLADIAAVTNNNDGFGGNNGWWILIILFAIFGGWGNAGWGTGGAQGAANDYVLASDFATLQRQLSDGFSSMERKGDTINAGLCNGFYTEAQLINGLDKSIANSNYGLTTQLNSISAQNAACCCDIKSTINTSARDIIDNDNANYRALDAKLTAMEMSAKDDKIAALTADVQALRFAASQCDQNTYLVNTLRPSPVPAYTVANPYCNCSNVATCCAC